MAFASSEDGAITVDWVVLTALIIGIQIVILVGTMRDSMVEVTDTVAAKVEEQADLLD
jgi:hypothetical protein